MLEAVTIRWSVAEHWLFIVELSEFTNLFSNENALMVIFLFTDHCVHLQQIVVTK